MNIFISSKIVDNYLLIEGAGNVDIEEYKALPERYYNEIVELLSKELPEEIKGRRVGFVLPFSYIHIAKYWERSE